MGDPAEDYADLMAPPEEAYGDLMAEAQPEPESVPSGHRDTGEVATRGTIVQLGETTVEGDPSGGGRVSYDPSGERVDRNVEERIVVKDANKPETGDFVGFSEDAPMLELYQQGLSGNANAWDEINRRGTGGVNASTGDLNYADEPPDSASYAGIEAPSMASATRAVTSEGDVSDRLSALLPREDADISTPEYVRAFGATDRLTPTETQRAYQQGRDVRELGPLTGRTAPVRWGASALDRLIGTNLVTREDRELADQVERQAPRETALGEASTMMGLTAPLGGLGADATWAERIGLAGLEGGTMGALRGAGESERGDVGGMLSDAGTEGAVGAVTGMGTAGAFEAAGPALRRLARRSEEAIPGVQNAADRARLESTGAWGRAQARRLQRERGEGGMADLAEWLRERRQFPGESRARPIGEGGIGGRLLGPASPNASEDMGVILEDSGPAVGNAARDIGQMARQAAESAGDGARAAGHVDLEETARHAERLAQQMEREASSVTEERAVAAMRREAEALRRAIERNGDSMLPFDEAWDRRRQLDRTIRTWARDQDLFTNAGRMRELRRALNRQMTAAAEELGGGAADLWRSVNREAHNARTMLEMGLGERALSVGGGVGGATAQGQMLAETMDNPTLANAARTLAVRPGMQYLRMRTPGVMARGLEGLAGRLRSAGPNLGRYADMLERAAQRGGNHLAAAHYALSRRNPEYRQAIEAMSADTDEPDTESEEQ